MGSGSHKDPYWDRCRTFWAWSRGRTPWNEATPPVGLRRRQPGIHEHHCRQHQSSRSDIHCVPVESARVVDSQLSLSAHVTALCRSCYYQLRPAARSLSTETAKTLVQTFVSCRLDYCNSLMYGVADSLIRRVQSIQNAAARLITRARRQEHITPASPSTSAVQTGQYHVQVTIWSGHSVLGGWCSASCWQRTDGVSFDQPTTEHASFLGHRTVLATETFLLPDLQCELKKVAPLKLFAIFHLWWTCVTENYRAYCPNIFLRLHQF